MKGTCRNCAAHLESLWKFCPHCGAANAREAPEATHQHPDHENAPVKSGLSGLLLGLLAAPVLIIYGGMICLTGLGVFLGIPMIVAGVCAPLMGSLMGLNALRGKCPWCSANLSGVGVFDRFSCSACNARIVVRKGELARAE